MNKNYKWIVCSIFLMISSNVHAIDEVLTFPGSKTNYCSKGTTYLSADQSYKFKIPDFGKQVFIKENVISPDITYHVEFANIDAVFFNIVSTKIRDDLPKNSVFIVDRLSKRYQGYKKRFPEKFKDMIGEGELGVFYQFELLNATRSISKKTPYPIALGISGGKEINSVGLHQYFVADGFMYEFAVLVHNKLKDLQGDTKKELSQKAKRWLEAGLKAFSRGEYINCEQLF